jgi:phosphoglycolate phosphatase-like HAD superfamily hydrolase
MDMYSNLVHYIRVPNTGTPKSTSARYTKTLAKTGNQYASALFKTSSANFMNKGLNRKIANQLKTWSETQETKYALFDFDGTIIASEGFSLDAIQGPIMQFTSPMMDFLLPTFYARGGTRNRKRRKPQKTRKYRPPILEEMVESQHYQNTLTQPLHLPSKEFLDDMFAYLIRPDRVEMIRDLFGTLLSNGVHIHIFTQNPYASTANPYRKIFVEMLWRVVVHLGFAISKEDIDGMLHSTIDYTNPGEPALKRNIFRVVVLGQELNPAK